MKKLMLAVSVMLSLNVYAKPKADKVSENDVFYVYQEKSGRKNHFIPSGWMGDFGDLKLNDNYRNDCVDGATCIEWKYSAEGKQSAYWTGVFWQQPANNWGSKAGGFDLTGYKKLTFWAKAATDNVRIEEFKVGGITGEFGDSDSASIGPIVLSKDWKKYTIDLADKNLSHIIGGFCWAANKDNNPTGFTMYLDEIRYEK